VAAAKADTFLGERYRRIARRRGKKKAIVAVGCSILVIIWHLLYDPQARFHLGPEFYDNRTGLERKKRIHFRQLEALGYKVTLEPAAGRRFARRAAIRDGQVVVLCTVPGWLSD
jgi:hypothetical protein